MRMKMLLIKEVEDILNDKNVKIFETVFIKRDGKERHMFFTIDNEIIEQLGIIYKATKTKASNPDVVNVVELVKNGNDWVDAQYRSFRKDSVMSLKKAII